MNEEITIGVSNRHIHLTKEVYEYLFDEPLEEDRPLTQPGQFAAKQKVTLKTDNYEIENVRILGPLRNYNQIEISHNDALKFKINPPVRASGDVNNSERITVIHGDKSVVLEGCILAQRHVHMSKEDADKRNLKDGQKVFITLSGQRAGVIECYVKITDGAFMEAHVDTDDANAFLINNDNNKGVLFY